MFLKNYTFTTLVLDFLSGSWIFIFGKLYTFYIKRLGILWGVVSGHLQVSVLKKIPFQVSPLLQSVDMFFQGRSSELWAPKVMFPFT